MNITLATLPEASAQEVFNQVVVHLLNQAEKSEFKYNCVYKNETGLKCAAGCLISNEEYIEDFEGGSWGNIVEMYDLSDNHSSLIGSLQDLHDSNIIYSWIDKLKELAKKYELNGSIIMETFNSLSDEKKDKLTEKS